MADWKDIHLAEDDKKIAALEARNARLEEQVREAYERAAQVAEGFQHPVESQQRRWEDGRFRHAEKSQLVPTGKDIATAIRTLATEQTNG